MNDSMPVTNVDTVVVGGGPSGLHCALKLAKAGLSVTVIDENHQMGGQYYKRRSAAVKSQFGDYRPQGSALIQQVLKAGVQLRTERMVWGVGGEDNRTLLTTGMQTPDQLGFRAKAIVVATGAIERAVPFPGWQLPGVIAAGHGLHVATCDVLPLHGKVVVAGTGPFLLPVAVEMLKAGCDVRRVIELNSPYNLRLSSAGAITQPGRLIDLAGYLTALARYRVPISQGWSLTEASGTGRVARISMRRHRDGAMRHEEADVLAIGFGFRPVTELLRLLGASCVADEAGDMIPEHDDFGRTSAKGVYVAGEARGVAGVHAALVRGELAAAAVTEDLELGPKKPMRRALRRSRSLDQFAALNRKLFPIPSESSAEIADNTMICRCEGVTAGQIRESTQPGWNDVNAVKGHTRAGMGECQGRECALSVYRIVNETTGCPRGHVFPARMPIKPIPLGSMAVAPEKAL